MLSFVPQQLQRQHDKKLNDKRGVQEMLNIILTNDDGYQAPGLRALYEALKEKFNVTIVAPSSDQSGRSHAATLRAPVGIHQIKEGYHLEGTPVDCVYFAIYALKLPIDLVVSGINHGPNLGDDRWYSGTVAAAREAALNNLPGIAISQICEEPHDLELFANFMAECWLQQAFLPKYVYNYNIPRFFSDKIVLCKPGRRERLYNTFDLIDNRGKKWLWFGKGGHGKIIPGTDFEVLAQHQISLTLLDYNDDDDRLA
jgi:5'-nucleotidase